MNSLSIGLGIPHSILGVNIDTNVLPSIEASVGPGMTIYDRVGLGSRRKYFLASPENVFRPRVSCFYGTNNIVYCDLNENLNQSYSCMSLGFGTQIIPKTVLFSRDLDVFYLVITNDR